MSKRQEQAIQVGLRSDMDWLDLLSPILLFSGSLVGYLFGKRKQAVEVEAISVSASKTAIESLLVTIDPLKAQIRDLEAEIKELKKLNKALMEENKALQEVVSDLRNFIQWADHYDPYFKNPPEWGGPKDG